MKLKIKAPLNNKATQLLLVNARVKNGKSIQRK